jgi:hypothetical protein
MGVGEMANRKAPDAKQQRELMEQAEERKSGYLRAWTQNPAFRAALHSQDEKVLRRNSKRVAYA